MTAVPNFYQLEYANVNLENYNACIDPPLDIQDGHIILSDRPGLGHDLNMDYIREHPDIPSKGYGIGWFDTTEPE
jgi:galactonate dehydratase